MSSTKYTKFAWDCSVPPCFSTVESRKRSTPPNWGAPPPFLTSSSALLPQNHGPCKIPAVIGTVHLEIIAYLQGLQFNFAAVPL